MQNKFFTFESVYHSGIWTLSSNYVHAHFERINSIENLNNN